MGWVNDLLVKLGIKQAPKAKRKYVRKAPSKPRVKKEKAASAPDVAPKQPPWVNGQVDASTIKGAVGESHDVYR